jgi:hypothetical protein
MTTASPIHMPPQVFGARAYLPDVLSVQCIGPIGDKRRQTEGATRMGFESRTVVRNDGEVDAELWKRVQSEVTRFKDRYGWNQNVAVVCDYDASKEDGRRWSKGDAHFNLIAALRYAVAHDPHAKVRFVASIALSQLGGWHHSKLG